jgi:hypothetical protein
MKTIYRGHEIDVKRERCLAGYALLYYSVFRVGDWYEVTSGYEDSAETVRDMVGHMKARVDAEIADGETFDPGPSRSTPEPSAVRIAPPAERESAR